MESSFFRSATCCLLAVLLPLHAFGADTALAMLYANGATWQNGAAVPASSALFAGDLVQTRSDSVARINATGSSIMLLPDTLLKFQSQEIDLQHGAIRVATSKNLQAKAEDVTIRPATDKWTEFQVADVDGDVQVMASKGDLTLQSDQGTTTLPEGQQTTVNTPPQKKHKKKGEGAVPGARGGLMSSRNAIIAGTVIIGGITAWALLQDSEPMSPSCRNNNCPP